MDNLSVSVKGKQLIFENGGSIYKGGFKDATPDGEGKITCNDGRRVEVIWESGAIVYQRELIKDWWPHWRGKWKLPNGCIYKGEWMLKDGKWNGEGAMKSPTGESYKGEWKDNKRDGNGTYTWPDMEVHTRENGRMARDAVRALSN